jgi:hypothetical protein
MCSNCHSKIKRAADAFRSADRAATVKDSVQAFFGAPALAGRCAEAEGLPTDRRLWDHNGKDLFVTSIMSLGMTGNDWESVLLNDQIHSAVESKRIPLAA